MKTLCRKCIVTGQIKPVDQLIRIVRTKDGDFFVNSDAKGRGAYITNDPEVIRKVKKRILLHKVFKQPVSKTVYKEIENLIKE